MRSSLRRTTVAPLVAALAVSLNVRAAGADGRSRAGPGFVYVALGASGEEEGAAQAGDPALIGARLAAFRAGVRVVDLTARRATIHEVVAGQLAKAIALRPGLVTVAVGPADVEGTPLRSFSRDLQILADALYRNRARAVFSSLAAAERLRPRASPRLRRRIDAFDFAIRRVARRYGFPVADLRAGGGAVVPSWADAVGAEAERVVAAPGASLELGGHAEGGDADGRWAAAPHVRPPHTDRVAGMRERG